MDYGFVNAKEGTETCQDGLIIEESSVGNGAADADGAQARGAERVSAAQGVQEVERNDSMDSEGIVGAGAQFGAVEDVEDVVATMGNGTVAGADGVQARGAGELGDAQGAQVVGRSDSMGLEDIAGAGTVVRHSDPLDSGGIAGAGTQLGATEDVGATNVGTRAVGRGGKSRGRRTRNPGHQRKKG